MVNYLKLAKASAAAETCVRSMEEKWSWLLSLPHLGDSFACFEHFLIWQVMISIPGSTIAEVFNRNINCTAPARIWIRNASSIYDSATVRIIFSFFSSTNFNGRIKDFTSHLHWKWRSCSGRLLDCKNSTFGCRWTLWSFFRTVQ